MSSIKLESNASGTGIFTIASPNSNTNRTLTLPDATGTIITTAGGAAISGTTGAFTTTVGVGGATPSTSGAGITFPATASASSDANTLDDYEEGTFSPTLRGTTTAGTGTYSTQNGTYIKIGRSVTVFGYIRWSAHTGTGSMQIGNLPFTSFSNGDNYSVAPVFLQNMALTASNYAQAIQVPNTITIDLYQYPTGGGLVTTIPMDTSAEIGFSATYLATA